MPIETDNNRVDDLTTNEFRLAKIYITSGFFIVVALMQLSGIRSAQFIVTDCVPVPNFLWMVIVLVCLTLMVFMELFDKFPINWVLGIVAVESMTMCIICYYWNSLPMLHASIIVLSVVVLSFTLYLMGAFMPLAILPGFNSMMIITIAFIIGYILIVVFLHVLNAPKIVMLILDIWTLWYEIPLILYASSLIHHRHLTHLVSEEYMLSATIISTFFLYLIHLLTATVTHSNMVRQAYSK